MENEEIVGVRKERESLIWIRRGEKREKGSV